MKQLTTLGLMIALGFTGQLFAEDGHSDHGHKNHSQNHREKKRIAVQNICPVSGEKLGAHGEPIKVTVGEKKEEIFLCCKACLEGKIDAKNWGTIHANIAKAQGKCPVMKKDLPNNPKWTVVEGQIVFVCCPPCTGKIERDPKTYLGQVDEYYHQALTAQKN